MFRNVNVTAPGGDGNPGARKKAALRADQRSQHVATHPKRARRRQRALERLMEAPEVA